MNYTFNYIRNRIAEHSKDEMLEMCHETLANRTEKNFPYFFVFVLMKWTILFGNSKYPLKKLTPERFSKIFNIIASFNDDHISNFLKSGQLDKAFSIIYNQQFYLQRRVGKQVFSTQLKLLDGIKGRYDINQSFMAKTGLSIYEFLYIGQLIWLVVNSKKLGTPGLYFNGKIDKPMIDVFSQVVPEKKVIRFIKILLLHPRTAETQINNFKHRINNTDLQTMEISFFTMYPFKVFQNQIKLVHPSLFNHAVNYYLYDYLKANDDRFSTEFGYRLEHYVGLGLLEIEVDFKTEKQLKRILKESTNQVDYWLPDDYIFIEVKATELQAYPAVNPKDELLYNSLKTSIFKAYFKQIVPVSKELNPAGENWGIIVTYKEFFWSNLITLAEIGKPYYDEDITYDHIPPSNVFIVDIYTWDLLIRIVKDKKLTLLGALQLAKSNNSDPATRRQLFHMHLDPFKGDESGKLSYLTGESEKFEIRRLSEWTE